MRHLITALSRRLFPPAETLEGYEQTELVEVIFQKTLAYRPQDAWPEMAGVSTVLDFGGGCGAHYKSAMILSPNVRWAVVETTAMAAKASELATDKLQFFTDILDAKNWLGTIDVMHSNGALQYTHDPIRILTNLCQLNASVMIWKRLCLSVHSIERTVEASHLIHSGPGQIHGVKNKTVRLDFTKIPESTFLNAHQNYTLEKRGPDWFLFILADNSHEGR